MVNCVFFVLCFIDISYYPPRPSASVDNTLRDLLNSLLSLIHELLYYSFKIIPSLKTAKTTTPPTPLVRPRVNDFTLIMCNL